MLQGPEEDWPSFSSSERPLLAVVQCLQGEPTDLSTVGWVVIAGAPDVIVSGEHTPDIPDAEINGLVLYLRVPPGVDEPERRAELLASTRKGQAPLIDVTLAVPIPDAVKQSVDRALKLIRKELSLDYFLRFKHEFVEGAPVIRIPNLGYQPMWLLRPPVGGVTFCAREVDLKGNALPWSTHELPTELDKWLASIPFPFVFSQPDLPEREERPDALDRDELDFALTFFTRAESLETEIVSALATPSADLVASTIPAVIDNLHRFIEADRKYRRRLRQLSSAAGDFGTADRRVKPEAVQKAIDHARTAWLEMHNRTRELVTLTVPLIQAESNRLRDAATRAEDQRAQRERDEQQLLRDAATRAENLRTQREHDERQRLQTFIAILAGVLGIPALVATVYTTSVVPMRGSPGAPSAWVMFVGMIIAGILTVFFVLALPSANGVRPSSRVPFVRDRAHWLLEGFGIAWVLYAAIAAIIQGNASAFAPSFARPWTAFAVLALILGVTAHVARGRGRNSGASNGDGAGAGAGAGQPPGCLGGL